MMAKYQRREEPSETKGDAGLLREVQDASNSNPAAFTPISPERENGIGRDEARSGDDQDDGRQSPWNDVSMSSLPTLSSLGGLSQQPNIGPINDVEIDQGTIEERKKLREDSYKKNILEDGEETFESYVLGIIEELKMVEWPPFDKVVKITVVVMASIIFAFVYIYLIDGLFHRLADLLFNTDVDL